MSRDQHLQTIRALVRAYQAFEHYSATHIRQFGLTPAQFDILATLGNTEGMSPKQLCEKTLITKGTLTGVLDRMATKKWIKRLPSLEDGRSQIVCLTAAGQKLFERVFPAHLEYLSHALGKLSQTQHIQTTAALTHLRQTFDTQEIQ